MNVLDLWKTTKELSIDLFMCLLFEVEPKPEGVRFNHLEQENWPENAALIYRMLKVDRKAKRIRDIFKHSPIDTRDPVYDDFGDAPSSYDYDFGSGFDEFLQNERDADYSREEVLLKEERILKSELAEWLLKNEIAYKFPSLAKRVVELTNLADNIESTIQCPSQATATEEKSIDSINTPAKPKKKYQRGAISAAAAAGILGVSTRQVQNWDANINRPDGYPGRRNEAAFQLFANEWKRLQFLNKQARAMNHASSGGWLIDDAEKSAFDDE